MSDKVTFWGITRVACRTMRNYTSLHGSLIDYMYENLAKLIKQVIKKIGHHLHAGKRCRPEDIRLAVSVVNPTLNYGLIKFILSLSMSYIACIKKEHLLHLNRTLIQKFVSSIFGAKH